MRADVAEMDWSIKKNTSFNIIVESIYFNDLNNM